MSKLELPDGPTTVVNPVDALWLSSNTYSRGNCQRERLSYDSDFENHQKIPRQRTHTPVGRCEITLFSYRSLKGQQPSAEVS